jgi:hypothetical protein
MSGSASVALLRDELDGWLPASMYQHGAGEIGVNFRALPAINL